MANKILIADDEATIRDLIRLSLESEGYEIFEARNGLEALSKAREVVPDLIILDVMMPGKIGYQVCTELKRDPATQKISIIFLTSRDTSLSLEAVHESGGDDFISKPFKPQELKARIRKAMGSGL
jgi:DNA-binding response OmpR family regulator